MPPVPAQRVPSWLDDYARGVGSNAGQPHRTINRRGIAGEPRAGFNRERYFRFLRASRGGGGQAPLHRVISVCSPATRPVLEIAGSAADSGRASCRVPPEKFLRIITRLAHDDRIDANLSRLRPQRRRWTHDVVVVAPSKRQTVPCCLFCPISSRLWRLAVIVNDSLFRFPLPPPGKPAGLFDGITTVVGMP